MPLASDAVAFFLPILRRGHWNQPSSLERHEQGQERAFGAFWNAQTSSLLVIPTLLYLHNQDREQKTTFAYLARTSTLHTQPTMMMMRRASSSRLKKSLLQARFTNPKNQHYLTKCTKTKRRKRTPYTNKSRTTKVVCGGSLKQ